MDLVTAIAGFDRQLPADGCPGHTRLHHKSGDLPAAAGVQRVQG